MPPLAVAGLTPGWPVLSPFRPCGAGEAGDDGAFDALMRETSARVMAIGWRLLGTPGSLAMDAAQETMRAYRYLRTFRPDRDFEAWICRIAMNVCRDLYRRNRAGAPASPVSYESEREAGRMEEPASASDSESSLLQSERRRLVLEAIAKLLPPREKAALVLRDLEGMTSERVAKILGSTPGTVRSQVAAGRRKVKLALEARIGRGR